MSQKPSKRAKELRRHRRSKEAVTTRVLPRIQREPFILRHFVEILLCLILVGGAWAIWKYNPLKKNPQYKEYESILDSLSIEDIEGVENRYSQGYCIFVISPKMIVPRIMNSLPLAIKVDWSAAKTLIFQETGPAISLSDYDQKRIIFDIPVRYYLDQKNLAKTFNVIFIRGKKNVYSVGLGTAKFSFEILEDRGDYILAVMGVNLPLDG